MVPGLPNGGVIRKVAEPVIVGLKVAPASGAHTFSGRLPHFSPNANPTRGGAAQLAEDLCVPLRPSSDTTAPHAVVFE